MSKSIYYFNKNNIIKKLIIDIENYKQEYNALDRIKRVYKKTGGDFHNLKNNFENLSFNFEPYYNTVYCYCEKYYYYDIEYNSIKEDRYYKCEIYLGGNLSKNDITPQFIEKAIISRKEKINQYIEEKQKLIQELLHNKLSIIDKIEDLKQEYNKLSKEKNSLYYILYDFFGYGG